jgi:hypothetical protein
MKTLSPCKTIQANTYYLVLKCVFIILDLWKPQAHKVIILKKVTKDRGTLWNKKNLQHDDLVYIQIIKREDHYQGTQQSQLKKKKTTNTKFENLQGQNNKK